MIPIKVKEKYIQVKKTQIKHVQSTVKKTLKEIIEYQQNHKKAQNKQVYTNIH